jgi:hypothetical protein
MRRYRALAERLISCTCGSTAATDPARHAENCHRRLWREAMDEIDAALANHEGGVEERDALQAAIKRHGFRLGEDERGPKLFYANPSAATLRNHRRVRKEPQTFLEAEDEFQ